MKLHALLLLTISLSAANASAANEFGNGGDVIICADGKVEFFDWYETHDKHGWPIQVPHGATLAEKVDHLLERMLPLNPWRVSKYKKQATTFWSEAKFIPEGRRLVDIPDTDNAYIPDNCKIAQLVVQGKPVFPGDMQYTFDRDYWNRLSLDQQAAVVVHEIILRDATENSGQKDSRRTRYANALILSDRFKNFGEADMVKTLSLIGFRSVDAFGFYLDDFTHSEVRGAYYGELSPEMAGKTVTVGPISGEILFEGYGDQKAQNSFDWNPSEDSFDILVNDFKLVTNKLPGIPGQLKSPVWIGSFGVSDHGTKGGGSLRTSWENVPKLYPAGYSFAFTPDPWHCAVNDSNITFYIERGKFVLASIDCDDGELDAIQGFQFEGILFRNGKPAYFRQRNSDNSAFYGTIHGTNWSLLPIPMSENHDYYEWPFHSNGYVKTAKCLVHPGCASIPFIDGSTRDVKSGEVCEFEDAPTERAISCE